MKRVVMEVGRECEICQRSERKKKKKKKMLMMKRKKKTKSLNKLQMNTVFFPAVIRSGICVLPTIGFPINSFAVRNVQYFC
jgi:hypothetical protein